MKKYISVLLVLFVLTMNALAVIDSGATPIKDGFTVMSNQNDTNQTNQTNTTNTPQATVTIPVIMPTDTPQVTVTIPVIMPTDIPSPEPTESPGFDIIIAAVGILVIYIFGRKAR